MNMSPSGLLQNGMLQIRQLVLINKSIVELRWNL